jgi:hypothetical protein
MKSRIAHAELEPPVSAQDLLKLYRQLSVPHFQRGLVWDTDSISLLLESLFYGTPCGSITLWHHRDVDRLGKALGSSPAYLIVDGQQRIRSLQGVLNPKPGSESAAEETYEGDETRDARIWCLNLGRLPDFEDQFPGGKRFELFRYAKDPRHSGSKELSGAPLQDQQALLPLMWFLDRDDDGVRRGLANRAIGKSARAVLENVKVKQNLRRMFSYKAFHVSKLSPDLSLADVVGVYNRINRAGKRVEAEERAFANVVSAHNGANQALRRFFQAVHPNSRSRIRSTSPLDRDGLLARQKENRFGFKLFMRAFAQVLASYSDKTVSASTLSFDSVDPDSLRPLRTRLPEMLDTTVRVLRDVAGAVRSKPLNCDDLRMLPDTKSLWPLLQLLIRFPGLAPAAKDVLPSLALRLLLADLETKEILRLCQDVDGAKSAHEAVRVLDRHRLLRDFVIRHKVRVGLKDAKSLNHRFVLMTYWLIRGAGGRDFRYATNDVRNRAALRKTYKREPVLSEAVRSERQHIVPFKRLKAIFNIEATNVGDHEANDVANLTYISGALNSFDRGLGSHPMKLLDEPRANLNAHMLRASPTWVRLYSKICDSSESSSQARSNYLRWCKLRRRLIERRFLKWVAEVTRRGRRYNRPRLGRMRPRQTLRPAIESSIRGLGYRTRLEGRLVILCGRLTKARVSKSKALLSYQYKSKRGRVLRVDLKRGGIVLRIRDKTLATALKRRFPRIKLAPGKKGSTKCPLDSRRPLATQVITWLTNRRELGAGGADSRA